MPLVCGDLGGAAGEQYRELSKAFQTLAAVWPAARACQKSRSVNALPYLKWCGYGSDMHVSGRLDSAGHWRLSCDDTWQ